MGSVLSYSGISTKIRAMSSHLASGNRPLFGRSTGSRLFEENAGICESMVRP